MIPIPAFPIVERIVVVEHDILVRWKSKLVQVDHVAKLGVPTVEAELAGWCVPMSVEAALRSRSLISS